MTQRTEALHFGVRPAVLAAYGGRLALVVAVLTSIPLLVSLLSREWGITVRYTLVIAVFVSIWYVAGRRRAATDVQTNEALVLGALAFLLAPLATAYPLAASGLAPLDAVFEAISGITTTGLSMVTDIGSKPHTFRFARAWMQWYGGLGVMVLSLALIVAPGTAARRLGAQERDGSDLAGSTRAYARRVLIAYLLVTLAGVLGLLLVGVAPDDAVAYVLAAVSTGGFSPQAGSLAPLGAAAAILVTLLCVVCAVPLVFWTRLLLRRFGSLRHVLGVAPEPQVLLFLCIGFTAALAACFRGDGMNWGDALYHSLLMGCSAQTTSGFSSIDPGEVGAASKLVMIASMMIGGNVGSTAGGFKIVRLLIFLRLVWLLVRRTCLTPHTVFHPRLGGRRLESDEIQEALMVILLFSGVILVSWFPFLLAGFDPLDSLFEVVSATNTVGLSTGITGPELSSHLKVILCADMLLGRLEIFTWLVFLYPGSWLGKRRSTP